MGPYVKPVVWVCVGFIGLLATYLLGLGPTHGIRRVNGLAYSDGCDGGVPYIPICGVHEIAGVHMSPVAVSASLIVGVRTSLVSGVRASLVQGVHTSLAASLAVVHTSLVAGYASEALALFLAFVGRS